MEFDEDLMIPDKRLSISEGAITVMGWQSCTDKKSFTYAILDALSKEYGFSLDTPFEDYPKEVHDVLIHGTNGKAVKVYLFLLYLCYSTDNHLSNFKGSFSCYFILT